MAMIGDLITVVHVTLSEADRVPRRRPGQVNAERELVERTTSPVTRAPIDRVPLAQAP